MKKSQIIYAFIFLISFYSCQDSGGPQEPAVWYHNFVFLDEEGRDLFNSNPHYSLDEFSLCFTNDDRHCYKLEVDRQGILDLIQKDGGNLIGMVPRIGHEDRRGERYFLYGNGDIDTLTFNWAPIKELPKESYENLDYFQIFLNGKLVHEYNFKEKKPAWYMLVSNNGSKEKDGIYKIYINKKPQPEEFDQV